MTTWILLVLTNILITAVMVIFGRRFMKKPPEDMDGPFGYRTAMSRKNRDTWNFAHKYIGKIWFYLGLILIPSSVIPMLFVIGKDEHTIGTTGIIIEFGELFLMIVTIVFTEKALRKKFDKNGNKKGEQK